MKFGVVDYGTGNVRSLMAALGLYADVGLSSCPKELSSSDCIVLPGVGSFGQVSSVLKERGLFGFLRTWALSDRPLIGICLGMQLFFDSSEESEGASGLGLLPGIVSKMRPVTEKIPNIGWRETLFNFREPSELYYCHSYVVPSISASLATCQYGEQCFNAEINVGNQLIGFQYHPEKSGPVGLAILRETVKLLENRNE